MPDEIHTFAVQAVSRALLGSKSRLEVAAFLADRVGRVTYVREVARNLQFNDPDVKRDFGKFEDAGILISHGRPVLNGPEHYEPSASSFWNFSKELLAEVRSGLWIPSRSASQSPTG
jgi:hypothetical protein